MPYYFLVARNGQEIRSSHAYTARQLREFKNQASCYTFVGELTNSVKNIGLGCRRRRGLRDGAPPTPAAAAPAPKPAAPVAPAAKPVAGWWPFGKKKAKRLDRDPRRMAQTVMYIPSPTGRVNQVMRGAKRRKRRRR